MARKRLDTCLLMLNKLCCVRCLLKNVDFTGIRAVASVKIGFCSLRLYTLFPGSTYDTYTLRHSRNCRFAGPNARFLPEQLVAWAAIRLVWKDMGPRGCAARIAGCLRSLGHGGGATVFR